MRDWCLLCTAAFVVTCGCKSPSMPTKMFATRSKFINQIKGQQRQPNAESAPLDPGSLGSASANIQLAGFQQDISSLESPDAVLTANEKSPAIGEALPAKLDSANSNDRGTFAEDAEDIGSSSDGTLIPSSEQVSVSLNQLMLASLNNHPAIRIELEKLQQSRADFWTSSLKPNPELDSSFTLIPLTRPFTEDRQGGPPQFDIGLAYPIDWFLFGKRAAAMRAAHLSVHVSQAEFENMVRLRVVDTALAYFDALEAKALRNLAKTNVETFRRVLKVTEDAIEDGGRPAIEGKRITLDLLNAKQELTTATAVEKTANARLKIYLGIQGESDEVAVEGNLNVVRYVPPIPLQEAVALARQNRPDLLALRWQLDQTAAEINNQIRSAKPTITPSLGYTRQYQEKAIGFPDANSWGAGVNMSIPLQDRNQGNIAKAASIRRAAASQLALANLELEAEVAQTIAELQAAESNARSIESEQLELAREVLDSIEIAYANGGRPLIDVLDAQRNFREINSRSVTAQATYWRSLYKYLAAIGQSDSAPIEIQQ